MNSECCISTLYIFVFFGKTNHLNFVFNFPVFLFLLVIYRLLAQHFVQLELSEEFVTLLQLLLALGTCCLSLFDSLIKRLAHRHVLRPDVGLVLVVITAQKSIILSIECILRYMVGYRVKNIKVDNSYSRKCKDVLTHDVLRHVSFIVSIHLLLVFQVIFYNPVAMLRWDVVFVVNSLLPLNDRLVCKKFRVD